MMIPPGGWYKFCIYHIHLFLTAIQCFVVGSLPYIATLYMILIVDDKQENILTLRKTLELHAFEVDTALSGEEALKKILKNDYYLVILDVQMPGMDGFEVAEAISGLKKTRNLPILFLSAVNTHKKFVTKGFETGGFDYLTKPFDPDILILKVRTFYRMYQQSRQLAEAHAALQQEMEYRKKTEKSLVETVEQLHSTLESLPAIAFTAKPDGTIDFVNRLWFAYSDSKRNFPATRPSTKSISELWQDSFLRVKPLNCEVELKQLRSDEYVYFLLSIIPVIVDGKLSKWIGTFTNIHEQKLLNEFLEQKVMERTRELVEANRELEATNNDLQQFASVAWHDLKEPLRKIRTFSSIINGRFKMEEEARLYFDKIDQSSERMNLLIEDLLNFSKLSSPAAFSNTDLNNILQEVLSDLELIIYETNAEISSTSLPRIDVYPGLLRQAFQNLVSNSLKFSQPGKPPQIRITHEFTDECSFESPAVNNGPYVRLRFTDNGIGFDQKYADRIFLMFQRLHPKDEYEGTGIGLTIVKKIVEKHHGIIKAASCNGQGAQFVMVLPVKQKKQDK
jgi:Bacteriophytochrome (light-regulated signal transduction histidine kinase)